jgi:hypothetical protein
LIPCQNIIEDNRFINNTALQDGGAIKYNSYPPILNNNTFTNNQAVYGPNVASYPVKIMRKDGSELVKFTSVDEVPSGEKLEHPIPLAIVDVDGVISK